MPATLDEKIKSILQGSKKQTVSEGRVEGVDDNGVATAHGHSQASDKGVGQDSVADDEHKKQKRGQTSGFKPSGVKGVGKDGVATAMGHDQSKDSGVGTDGDGAMSVEMNPDNARNNVSSEELKIDVTADVAALVEGESLSEDFKKKAATIYEAAVISRVRAEITKIEEKYNAQIEEEVNELMTGVVEKIDGYLSYVVEQWTKNNEVALESGIKAEIAENFMQGMKRLFDESYVEIPEDKFDVVSDLDAKVTELTGKLDETVAANVQLTKELNDIKKNNVIGSFTDGLTATEADKFKSLAKEIAFESEDVYKGKLTTIKESYFKKDNKKQTVLTETVDAGDASTVINEEADKGTMSRYAKALDKK